MRRTTLATTRRHQPVGPTFRTALRILADRGLRVNPRSAGGGCARVCCGYRATAARV